MSEWRGVSHWTERLKTIGACDEAVEWAGRYSTLQVAWDACERGDWMLWLCGKFAGEPWDDGRRRLVLAACECARPALAWAGEVRPQFQLDLHESWARGEVVEQRAIRAASEAARAGNWGALAAKHAMDASHAASSETSDVASLVAGCAAEAAMDANRAASRAERRAAIHAGGAPRAESWAAMEESRRVSGEASLKTSAEIVRKHYPEAPEIGS